MQTDQFDQGRPPDYSDCKNDCSTRIDYNYYSFVTNLNGSYLDKMSFLMKPFFFSFTDDFCRDTHTTNQQTNKPKQIQKNIFYCEFVCAKRLRLIT